MHAWNASYVEENYPRQVAAWVKPGPDGTLYVDEAASNWTRQGLTSARDFGWAAACASELGDSATQDGLLAYADRYLHRSWIDGGLFYRRHDDAFDERGAFSAMDPHTGNALIAYARLNVPSGLKKLYERPWHEAHFREPALAEMSDNVDILRAIFDLRLNVLTLTLRRRLERSGTVSLGLANMWDRGPWNMLVDGRTVVSADGATIESCNGVEARRDGDLLHVDLAIEAQIDIDFAWTRDRDVP